MPNVIIERKSDGAQFSVDEAAFVKHYPDVDYKVVGEESEAAFQPVGIPAPKLPRRPARAKAVVKAKAAAPAPAPAPTAEVTG